MPPYALSEAVLDCRPVGYLEQSPWSSQRPAGHHGAVFSLFQCPINRGPVLLGMNGGPTNKLRLALSPVSSILLISLYHIFLLIILTMIHVRSLRDKLISRLNMRGKDIGELVRSKAIKQK